MHAHSRERDPTWLQRLSLDPSPAENWAACVVNVSNAVSREIKDPSGLDMLATQSRSIDWSSPPRAQPEQPRPATHTLSASLHELTPPPAPAMFAENLHC